MGPFSAQSENYLRSSGVLVVTLGVEPQVVTIALDNLLSRGEKISEVSVIYTESPKVRESLKTVEGEFARMIYPGVRLRRFPVISSDGPVKDFCTEKDLQALLRTLYGEIRRVRRESRIVNLCISGGRKVMGIMAMVVAQLLFGPEDRVWHLVTEGWQPGADRRLHIPPEEKVWLVPVPVLRWSEAGILMHTVAEMSDPDEVLAWYEKLDRAARIKRQREFLERWLTRAEREVVCLACRGMDNAAIAVALFKREQTVANQLRGVYEKLRDWLGYPDGNVDRHKLIAEFAPYFALVEGVKKREGN